MRGSPTRNRAFACGVSQAAELCRRWRHGGGGDFAQPGLAIVELRKRLDSDCGQDVLPAVDPIVPQQATHGVRPAHALYPLGLRIQFVDHGGDIV